MPSDLTGKIRKVDKDAFAYGSSTEIWKGEWKSPPSRSGYRWLAIKVIRTALPAPRVKELGEKLMREASLWADLDDPNVVPLLGMVYDMVPRGVPSLVSPYYQNRNLKEYMKRNRTQLSYSQMLDMTYQFASGLEYLHKSNIVHGDLKPDNIMISDGGEVVISDFGLSRILDAAGFTTKNFYGSVRYTAPELLGFGGPSGSSQPIRTTMDADIWAFAITSTEIFSSKLPYHNMKDSFVIVYVTKKNGKLNREDYRQEIQSESLWSLFDHCWKKEPHKRPRMNKVKEFLAEKRSERRLAR